MHEADTKVDGAALVFCVRADADATIGLGHLTRSKALGDVLKAHGRAGFADVRVLYACRRTEQAKQLLGSLEEPDVLTLPSDSTDIFAEIPALSEWLLQQKVSWLIVDHYGVTDAYLRALHDALKGAVRVLVMDDHQVRGEGVAALRLAPMQQPSPGGAPKALTGLPYLLIRKEFSSVKQLPQAERSALVICFGGADTNKLTRSAVSFLAESRRDAKDVEPIVVVASDAMAAQQGLDDLLGSLPTAKREAWLSPLQMAELFARARVALVSASGVACEACAMGCPVVAIEWAENQKNHAEALRGIGVPVFRGTDIREGAAVFANAGAVLAESAIDTFGAWRVSGEMLEVTPQVAVSKESDDRRISVRHVTMADCLTLLEWRNDKAVRAACRTTSELKLSAHIAWLAATIAHTQRKLWIVECDAKAAGYVRVDKDDARKGFELSWLVAPAFLGKGIASAGLALVVDLFPKDTKFIAEIFRGNEGSIRLASRLGFQLEAEHDNALLVYILQH